MKFLPFIAIGLFLSFNTLGQEHSDPLKRLRASLKKTNALYPKSKSGFRIHQDFKEKLDSIVFENYEEDYKSRLLLQYNSDWQVQTAYAEVYNFLTKTWFTEAKIEYTYNDDGKPVEITETWKDDDQTPWYFHDKTVISYTSSGYTELETYYRWDEDEQAWQVKYKTSYEYDSDGFIDKTYESEWDDYNSGWTNESYTTWTRDESNWISELRYYYWNEEDEVWEDKQYTLYTYDDNGNVAREDHFFNYWEEWEHANLYSFSYDESVLFSELATPPSEEYVSQGRMINKPVKMEYKTSYYDWETVYSTKYYFSTLTPTGIADPARHTLRLYPNPATDLITIDNGNSDLSRNGTFEVFNMQGVKVLSAAYKNNQFSISELEKGMYQIKITDNQKTYSDRIMVK